MKDFVKKVKQEDARIEMRKKQLAKTAERIAQARAKAAAAAAPPLPPPTPVVASLLDASSLQSISVSRLYQVLSAEGLVPVFSCRTHGQNVVVIVTSEDLIYWPYLTDTHANISQQPYPRPRRRSNRRSGV